MSKEISLAEVKKHDSDKSCWIVIHSNIYDVTKFLAEHPGGERTLLDYAGLDGTLAFEDVGHSYDAIEMMKKYKIGQVPDDERTASSSASCCKSPKGKTIKKPSSHCESCYSSVSQPLRISPSAQGCECSPVKQPLAERQIRQEKPWRTFDDDEEKRPQIQHIPCKVKLKQEARERRRALQCKKPKHRTPSKASYRSKADHIRERSNKDEETPACASEGGGFNLKWALLALAAALVAGVVLKKSLGG